MNCTNPGIAFEGMALTVGMMDYYIQALLLLIIKYFDALHYIFPLQFCLGVIGNSINLCVLLSSGMKNQANTLLSAMAFADLAFLLCMLPHSLASFSIFYKSIRFAYFYLLSKIHWVALANCFSTAATFLVLAVSLERFSGVRHPMHTRFQLRDTRLLLLIFTIYGLAFGLSLFHHLDYRVTIRVDCNKKRVLPSIHHISELNGTSPVLVRYVRIAKYVQSLFGVFVPVVAVAVLNVSLVYFLRKRQLLPRASTGSSGSSKKCQQQQQQQEFRYSDVAAFQRQERKVTATVIAIVSCFTITHLPTLGPVVWEHFVAPLVTASAILNSILVTGKVLNFFLFCSSSAHFRRRAVLILKAHLFRGRSRKKYSSLALSNVPTQTNVTSVVSNNMHGTSPGGTMCNNNAVFATAARCSRNLQNAKTGPNHSVINNHQNKSSTPTYRMPKQSTLSLRDALLRQQSGSECDDLLPPARVDADGIIRNGSQSARHSRTEFSN